MGSDRCAQDSTERLLHSTCLRPCCRPAAPPPLRARQKECPVCGTSYACTALLSGRRPKNPRIVGVIFCSRDCLRAFRERVGPHVNPLFYDFTDYRRAMARPAPARTCPCGELLERATAMCRMCRLRARVEKKILGESTRLAKRRKQQAARAVYRPLDDLPLVE